MDSSYKFSFISIITHLTLEEEAFVLFKVTDDALFDMLVFGENILDLWNEHERGFIIFDIIIDVCLS